MPSPNISIVIRTKNEERYLDQTLRAVRSQSLRPQEIIIVDSGSTDRTLEIAGDHNIAVLRMLPKQFSYGRALNWGYREARGSLLVSLSAHAVPSDNDWLAELYRPFQEVPNCVGVFSRQLPHLSADEYFKAEMENDDIFCGSKFRIQRRDSSFTNVSSMIKRAAWEEVPFDETVKASEDCLWARQQQALGRLTVFNPSSKVFHSHHDDDFRSTWRKTFNESLLDPDTCRRSRPTEPSFLREVLIKWLQTTIRRRIGPGQWKVGLARYLAYYMARRDLYNMTCESQE
jgi:rhamnosyltransferase